MSIDDPAVPADDPRVLADEDADRLTTELLTVLGPALAWWRAEAARRLGLDAASLVCVELARRRGTVTASAIVERTGLTRSAVSKLFRRLSDEGHVDLHGGGRRGLALEVTLRPHEQRDAELHRMRTSVRDRLRWSVGHAFDVDERATALRVLRFVTESVHQSAVDSADEAAERRRIARRRTLDDGR